MPTPSKPRILFFDIESTSLKASFGYAMCIGYKWLGDKKVTILGVDDYKTHKKEPWNDKQLLIDFAKVINEADIICGWFSKFFDVPFINTRLIKHGQPPIAPAAHMDLWFTAKKKLKMHSNRLIAVAEFFGVSDKTPVDAHWIMAQAGHAPSIKYIKDHCRGDITTLEAVYHKLLPLIEHPNVNVITGKIDGCPKCGASKLQKRGYTIAATTKTQRFHCTGCGGWSKGKPERVKGIVAR
jgi:uncharacterized protein YprB with RNaseH-like and TPR domain